MKKVITLFTIFSVFTSHKVIGQLYIELKSKKISVSASSYSEYNSKHSRIRYLSDGHPKNAIDGNFNYHWLSVDKDENAWINFSFKKQVMLSKIVLYSGFWHKSKEGKPTAQTKKDYYYNNRMSKIRIVFSDNSYVDKILLDELKPQIIEIDNKKTESVKIITLEFILGSNKKAKTQTKSGISEIKFFKIDDGLSDFITAFKKNDLRKSKKLAKKIVADMNNIQREKIINGYNPLEFAIRHGNVAMTATLLKSGFSSTYSDIDSIKYLSKNEVIQFSKIIANKRKIASQRIVELENGTNFDFEKITLIEKELKSSFAYIPNEDKKKLNTVLQSKKEEVVFNYLKEKLNAPTYLGASFGNLKELSSFIKKNNDKSFYLSVNDRSKIKSIIEERINILLSKLVLSYKKDIAIHKYLGETQQIDKKLQNFKNKFDGYLTYSSVAEAIKEIELYKIKIIENNYKILYNQIDKLNTIQQVKNFKSKNYLTFTKNYDSNLIKKLSTKLSNRKDDIIYKIEKERLVRIQENKRIEERNRIRETQRLMNETTSTGEPTAWQIKFALSYQIQLKNKELEDMSKTKITGGFSAYMKLLGTLGKGLKQKIGRFEKYGCVKANNKPGFNCDYVAKTNLSNNSIKTARFYKIRGVWNVVEYLD